MCFFFVFFTNHTLSRIFHHPSLSSLVCFHWISVIVMCLQESTVIMCAHKASGDPTVQSPAPVRTEAPALQRTARVCVHLGTEGPPANEVSFSFSSSLATSVISEQHWHETASGDATNPIIEPTLFWSVKNWSLPRQKHFVVGLNYLSVNPSSMLSLNNTVFTPAASSPHTHTHTQAHTHTHTWTLYPVLDNQLSVGDSQSSPKAHQRACSLGEPSLVCEWAPSEAALEWWAHWLEERFTVATCKHQLECKEC